MPDFLDEEGPRSVISKSLITPNREFEYFLDVSDEIDLKKGFWEYHAGKFVGMNDEKRHLGKIHVLHGRGKKNGQKIEHFNILNFNKEEGKCLADVMTDAGCKLTEFHNKILCESHPERDIKTIDISTWFNKTRFIDEYYVYYLSLFIRNFILFENFIADEKEEGKFTIERFLPSFQKIESIFGMRPIIVPLLPFEHEKSSIWYSYSSERAVGAMKKLRKIYE